MVGAVFIALFIVIFGVFYLYFSSRNKERLALIEKGADAEIFFSKAEKKRSTPVGKVIILNLAMLSMGVGLGVFIGSLIEAYTVIDEEVGYTGSIFLFAGLGLLIGFFLTKKLIDKD